MHNLQNLPEMIFIKYSFTEFGQDCLIIRYKANNFFHESDIGSQEFIRLFTLLQQFLALQEPYISLPEENFFPNEISKKSYTVSKYNLLLTILYYIYNYPSLNGEPLQYYSQYFQDINNIPVMNNNDKMILLFNLIEFELRYHIRSESELESLYERLIQFEHFHKTPEYELLFCYYIEAISLLLKNYTKIEEYSPKFIVNMNELYETNTGNEQLDLMKYLIIRNNILRVQSLEEEDKEKNINEIINYLETLLEDTKLKKEELSIRIGLKLYVLQERLGKYKECIATLEVLLKILKKEMLQGKSHRTLVEQLLYICGLLGYYNTMVGNNDKVQKYSKKMVKAINILRTMNVNSNQESINLIPKYGFYSVVLDKISNGGKNSEKEIGESIRRYQSKIKDCNDDEILNIFLMNYSQINENAFNTKYEFYTQILNNKSPLEYKQLFTFYVYHYNNLSLLHSIMSDNNLEEIRDLAKKLIDYTNYYIIQKKEDYFINIFQLNYFKQLLVNVYAVLISTYYYEKKLTEVMMESNKFLDIVKIQYEMENVNYSVILKLKGDALFQMENHKEAYNIYKEGKNKVIDPRMKANLLCNMALSGLFWNHEKKEAIELLDQALECVWHDQEKKENIEELIEKISKY